MFSYGIVEAKRFRRTLTAVINGKTVPQAVREGLVETDENQQEIVEDNDVFDEEPLLAPEQQAVSANPFAKSAEPVTANPFAKTTEEASTITFGNSATPAFNPQAPAFAPGMLQQPSEVSANPLASSGPFNPFATRPVQAFTYPFTKPESPFPYTGPAKVDSPDTAARTANPFSKRNIGNGLSFTPQSTPPKPNSQPFVFGAGPFNASTTATPVNNFPATSTATAPKDPFSFTPFTPQPIAPPISTTPQPLAFSWAKVEENTEETTQNTGDNTQNTGTWRTFRIFYSFTAASKMLISVPIYCSPSAPRSMSSHFSFYFFKTRLSFYNYTFFITYCISFHNINIELASNLYTVASSLLTLCTSFLNTNIELFSGIYTVSSFSPLKINIELVSSLQLSLLHHHSPSYLLLQHHIELVSCFNTVSSFLSLAIKCLTIPPITRACVPTILSSPGNLGKRPLSRDTPSVLSAIQVCRQTCEELH